MASTKTLLYYGALLHDIGRVVGRATASGAEHRELGATFIEDEVAPHNGGFAGEDGRHIVEQIRRCDAGELGATDLATDSLAYVTWFADAVASGGDARPETASADASLRKIFNTINRPDGRRDDNVVEHEDYEAILASLRGGLAEADVSAAGVTRLLRLLESTVDALPASTDPDGLIDVSLYDHAKTTACIAACAYEHLSAGGVTDYRGALLDGESSALGEELFLLYSCDMSGIQSFIYNISGSGALKQLRARSMYLELLLEHIVDELLERLGLNRTHLMYTGGGHAYLLLPNTASTIATLGEFSRELRAWFVDHYRTDLYVASAWVACSADDLTNNGPDKRRHARMYRKLSRRLSEAKAARYDAATICDLNFGDRGLFDHGHECIECHRSDLYLHDEGDGRHTCALCSALGTISKSLVERDVFVVERTGEAKRAHAHHPGLPLPFDCELRMYSSTGYPGRQSEARRVYVKNDSAASELLATSIWMGDYTAPTGDDGISAYALQGSSLKSEGGVNRGIQRLGVLRADVDDLGATFVGGLPSERVSVSRTATLSRSLSRFFKSRINDVLERGGYQVQIIYSGGDDLFMVGNWSDVLYAAIDIRKALDAYTGNGSLTISAGVGMFAKTYPIAHMAARTGELEDTAKGYVSQETGATKNAIALWTDASVFGWDEFIAVVEPRMREVRQMFEHNEKGSSLIYRLAELLREYDPVAAAPRLAYLLARSFEDDGRHRDEACDKIYGWAQDETERRRLIAALEWYVYSIREGSER